MRKYGWLSTLLLSIISCTNINLEVSDPVPEHRVGLSEYIGNWVMIASLSDEPLADLNADGVNSRNILEELPCRRIELFLSSKSTFILSANSWAYSSSNGALDCHTTGFSVEGNWSVNEIMGALVLDFSIDGNVYDTLETPVNIGGGHLTCRLNIPLFDINHNGDQSNVYGAITFKKL